MIRRLLKQVKEQPSKVDVDDLQKIQDDIESAQKKIAEERKKIKEEHFDGSRLTKHRFTI